MRHASVGLRLFAGCLVFICGVLHTQKVLAQSEKPVIIDGTKYIIHQVEKGHTLYAISKKYAISMDALLSANPGASAGVKVGDRLRIPVDKMDKMATTGSSPQIQSDLLIHTVAKKETLYSLARRYDITPAEILSANPGLGSTLSEGQLLRIPVKKGKNGQPSFYKEAEEEIATTHVVGANETLYSLSKLFNVSIDEIKAANGGLPQGLILGQTIKIPKKGEFERNSESSSSGTFPAPKGESMFTTQTPTPSNNSAVTRNAEYASGGSLKVVMMLPFEAARLDSVDKLGHDQVALEFYQGALIALDTVRSMGTDLNVYIYDSNKDGKRVKEIATKPDLSNADLFIGPMYKSELLALAEVSGARQAHIVCPVPQSGGILMNRPFISKAHCDDATQLSALTRFINRRYAQDNVLMIAPAKGTKEKFNTLFSAAYQSNRNGGTVLRELISDIPTSAQIEERLMLGKTNVIYIASNELAYITSLFNKLLDLQGKYSITVVGNEDWMKLDQIDNNHKNRLNLHIPLSHYVDYQQTAVKEFVAKYRERFGTDPNKYAFWGYDISFFYLTGMAKQGRSFFDKLSNPGLSLTSLRFKMERPSETVGFNNFGATIVRYRDYKLEIVN